MSNEINKPWYKHPLVWMVIAIPASAVIAGGFTIYLAVTTDDGLVVEDYYKQGMTINRQIEREAQAGKMQLAADVEVDPESGYIKVHLDTGLLPVAPAQINLALRHATKQREDNQVVLYRGQHDQYVGSFSGDIRKGIWYVELTNASDDGSTPWRLSKRVRIDALTRLQLQPDTLTK